jgi:hypothetical protein
LINCKIKDNKKKMEISQVQKIKIIKMMCINLEVGGKIYVKYLQEIIKVTLILNGYFH